MLEACSPQLEDQLVEGGRLVEGILGPAWPHAWAWRMHEARRAELAAAKLEVDKELRYRVIFFSMRRIFWDFCINQFGIGPLHYVSPF